MYNLSKGMDPLRDFESKRKFVNPPFMRFGEGFVRLGSRRLEFPLHCNVSFEGWYIGAVEVKAGATRITPWSDQEIEVVRKHNQRVVKFRWLPKVFRKWLRLEYIPLNNYQVL